MQANEHVIFKLVLDLLTAYYKHFGLPYDPVVADKLLPLNV